MEKIEKQIIDILKEKDNTAKYSLFIKPTKSPDLLLLPPFCGTINGKVMFVTVLTKENTDGSFQESRTAVFNTEAETLDACLEMCKTDQNSWSEKFTIDSKYFEPTSYEDLQMQFTTKK